MRIALTGASGFIGGHLCDYLLKKEHEVISLARSREKWVKSGGQGTFVAFDLDDPESGIGSLPENLDGFIHLAAVLFGRTKDDYFKANVLGLKKLLLPLIQKYQEKDFHFIFLSSIACAGPSIHDHLCNESSLERPVSHYGQSKWEAEKLIKSLLPSKWKLTIIRPPMVFGPRDSALLEVYKLINKGVAIYPGLNGRQKSYSYVGVYDLVNGIELSLYRSRTNQIETYYICYPQSVTLAEMHRIMAQSLGVNLKVSLKIPHAILKIAGWTCDKLKINSGLNSDKVREMIPQRWIFDSSKSQRDLGIKYVYDLSKISHLTAKDYFDRGWI